MNLQLVIGEIAQGVSPICATCKRYWEGREKNLPRPTCTTQKPCGSPIAGDTFSQYDGPMTDFTAWCFMCGHDSDFAVKVREEARVVGVCKGHVADLNHLIAAERADAASVLTVLSGSQRLPLLQLLPKPKPNVFDAIAQYDSYLDEEVLRRASR